MAHVLVFLFKKTKNESLGFSLSFSIFRAQQALQIASLQFIRN